MSKDIVFNAYDGEFKRLSEDVTKNLKECKDKAQAQSPQETAQSIEYVESVLNQMNDLMKQMRAEASSQDPATRKTLTDKVTSFQKTLQQQKLELERVKETSNKSSLIGVGEKSYEQRQKLLDTTAKLNKQNEMILNAQRTVAETEETGMQIQEELKRNREKIVSSQDKARSLSSITDNARHLISSMSRRDVQQKFILIFVACVLIIAIVITAYFMIQSQKAKDQQKK